ncbi:hypothetical protein H6P81_006301 [Aristolochia fimbriata]|uniref:Retrotransposon gag domain-containing protein n=1 Tax=Aristolochia fimbriata TaxID=158543 RepID=A0AAV7EX34_ARIFI|nr:hypothetical protein H6P81_006301 [Aristolochia fimbriata]
MEGQNQEEGAEKTMEHYVQSNPNVQRSAIVRPEVPSNFEIKPQILSMIQNNYQFGGLSHEDPNEHIEKFLEICDTFRFKDVTNEAVWLRLFPFTLRDRAKNWYHTLPPECIRNMGRATKEVPWSNDPYNNIYNPGWRNHPNFSWSNNNQHPNTQQPIAQTRPPPGFQKVAREPEQKSNLEVMISKILAKQRKVFKILR